MKIFEFNKHPHELFEQWYLASLGKADNQNIKDKLSIKTSYLLKNIFTRFVPSLDRMHSNAFVLSTASSLAAPSSRVVLLKDYSEQGLSLIHI